MKSLSRGILAAVTALLVSWAVVGCALTSRVDPDQFAQWLDDQPQVTDRAVQTSEDPSVGHAQAEVDSASEARDLVDAFKDYSSKHRGYIHWSLEITWEVEGGTSTVKTFSDNGLAQPPVPLAWEQGDQPLPEGFSARYFTPSSVQYRVDSLEDAYRLPPTPLPVEVVENAEGGRSMMAGDSEQLIQQLPQHSRR